MSWVRVSTPHDSVHADRHSTVMLQALKEEPPLNAKCKDKFLIQSTIITPEKESLGLADIVRFRSYLSLNTITHTDLISVGCLAGRRRRAQGAPAQAQSDIPPG